MELSAELRKELDLLSNRLVNNLKKIIRSKGLVDTGHLLKSIDAKIVFSRNGYTIEIIAEDYFKYLDNKYKLTDELFNSQFYVTFIDRLAEAYQLFLVQNL